METLKNKDIKNILSKKQQTIKTKTFIAVVSKNNLGFPRFAFIASRKFSKKAVERNRAKRLLRESVRLLFSEFKDKGYDIIFIARKYILNGKIQDVLEDMRYLLKYLREQNEKTAYMDN